MVNNKETVDRREKAISRLKKNLTGMGKLFTKYYDAYFETRSQLRGYGRHKANCAITIWIVVDLIVGGKPDCTCGWAKIEKDLKGFWTGWTGVTVARF